MWVIIALSCPEPLLLVAFNQLQKARKIRRTWADMFPDTLGLKGAFFLLMGGYTIKRKGEGRREPDFQVTLTYAGFEELLNKLAKYKKDEIEEVQKPNFIMRMINKALSSIGFEIAHSEPREKTQNLLLLESRLSFNPFDGEEVSERGSANGVSKAIALCQTLWFLIQCLIRKIHGLPVTLVEVQVCMQILHAAWMCVCWWEKPFDVNTTVVITLDEKLWDHIVGPGKEKEGEQDTHSGHTNRTDISTKVFHPDSIQPAPALKGTSSIEKSSSGKKYNGQGEKQYKSASICIIVPTDPPTHNFPPTEYSCSTEYLEKMFVVIEPTELNSHQLFYRTWHSIMIQLDRNESATVFCAIANATLHGLCWNAHFPSPVESILWKCSCFGMVIFPVFAYSSKLKGDYIEGSTYGVWKLRFLGLDRARTTSWYLLPYDFFALSFESIMVAREVSSLRVQKQTNTLRVQKQVDALGLQQAESEANTKAGFTWKLVFDLTYTFLGLYWVFMTYFAVEAFISIRSLPEGAYDLPPGIQIIPHI